jgi:hypothetical protein
MVQYEARWLIVQVQPQPEQKFDKIGRLVALRGVFEITVRELIILLSELKFEKPFVTAVPFHQIILLNSRKSFHRKINVTHSPSIQNKRHWQESPVDLPCDPHNQAQILVVGVNGALGDDRTCDRDVIFWVLHMNKMVWKVFGSQQDCMV